MTCFLHKKSPIAHQLCHDHSGLMPAVCFSRSSSFVNIMAFHNVLQRLQQAGSRRFNVLLFGAPGVGKGTFAKLIHQDFDFRQFSTGDYFREAIKKAESGEGELDAFTLKVNKILKSGQLVDDAVVVDVLKRLQENPATFMDGRYANARGPPLNM